MKKGLALTLMTVAIALVQVSNVQAAAPVIAEIFEVIIGDGENATAPATGTCVLVFPDALDLLSIVADDTTPTTGIKWSFLEITGRIEINGVASMTLPADDPKNPPAANRIDNQDLDPGDPISGSDGDPFTITFRDVIVSPNNTPNTTALPGELGNVALTLFASDSSTFSSRTFTVRTIKGSTDGVSIAGFTPVINTDFAGGGFQGWTGAILNPFTGGTIEPDDGSGLCMTVAGPGDNFPFFGSPERFIDLTAGTVYRARVELRNQGASSPAANTIPLVDFTFDSFTAGGGTLANNYGGFMWILDTGGGTNAAYGISRTSGRELFDWYFTPPGVNTATWNSTAFLAANDPFNDIRLAVRVNDVGAAIGALTRLGTICLRSITITSAPRSSLGGTIEDTVAVNTSNFDINGATGDSGFTVVDNGNGFEATSAATGSTVFNLVRDLGSGVTDDNLRFFPVQYTADTVYRVNVGVRMLDANASTDKPDGILIVGTLATSEKGFFNYSLRGGSTMLGAGLPDETASQVYEGYLGTENVTNATVANADRLRGGIQIISSDAIFGLTNGAGTIVIDSYSIENLGSLN